MAIAREHFVAWLRDILTSRAAEEDVEAAHEPDTSGWPAATEYSLAQIQGSSVGHFISLREELIDIKVGHGSKAARWKIHEALICHFSEYFNAACKTGRKVFELSTDDPALFGLFAQWIYRSSNPHAQLFPKRLPLNDEASATIWTTHAAETLFLAEKLGATEFSKYALSFVVHYADLMDVYDMEQVYARTEPMSPLRLFCAKWARFRCAKDPHLWETTRNVEFRRDRRAPIIMVGATQPADETNSAQDQIGSGKKTKDAQETTQEIQSESVFKRDSSPTTVGIDSKQEKLNEDSISIIDPRYLEIEHWYSECSWTSTGVTECKHNTDIEASKQTISRPKGPDLQRVLSKRHGRSIPTKSRSILASLLVTAPTVWLKTWRERSPFTWFLFVIVLCLAIIAIIVVLPIHYRACCENHCCKCCHCIPYWSKPCRDSGCVSNSSCGKCVGCCDCLPCHRWCANHWFLFGCSTMCCGEGCCGNRCHYLGGFPFCWCVNCCCYDGYINLNDTANGCCRPCCTRGGH